MINYIGVNGLLKNGLLINTLAVLTGLVYSVATLVNILLVSAGIIPIDIISRAKPVSVRRARVIIVVIVVVVSLALIIVAAIGAIFAVLFVSTRVVPIKLVANAVFVRMISAAVVIVLALIVPTAIGAILGILLVSAGIIPIQALPCALLISVRRAISGSAGLVSEQKE